MKLVKCHYCKKFCFCTAQVTELSENVISYSICKNCTDDLYPKEVIKTTEELVGLLKKPVLREITCICGFTAADFEKTGRFGCPKCYDVFQFYVKKFVEPYHKASEHIGKKPKKQNAMKEINDLKIKLNQAIELEQYEVASELKKELEKTIELWKNILGSI
jgi:protein arginine kinase activator